MSWVMSSLFSCRHPFAPWTLCARRYIEMLLDMCSRVLKDTRQTEQEVRTAAQLVMVVLHHCSGKVDQYLSAMLAMLNERLPAVSETQGQCAPCR